MESESLVGSGSKSPPPDYGTNREQSGNSGSPSQAGPAGPHEDGDDPNVADMARGSVCPLSACQVVLVVVAALMATLAVAMLAGGYQAMMRYAVNQQLVIKEGSTAYDIWKETPVPLSLRLHVFNLTNPDEVQKGYKPILEEVGPYVWREYHEKRNVSFHPNSTVTYLQQRWWVWDQEASGNSSQDDPIVTLNTIPVAAAYAMKYTVYQYALQLALNMVNEKLFVSTTAQELVFDGVKDPLLDWIQHNVVSENGSYHFLLPILEGTGGGITKFEKFAWFYKRNLSLTYDGVFNMMTGQDTIDNLGKIDNWNGRNATSFYTPPCNQLTGSAGELFPPQLSQKDLVFFSSDLCMSAKLFYNGTQDHGGLNSYRYWGTNHTFANGSTIPGNECYCVGSTCAPMGLLNAESCRMGAPAFVSFPHFYAADPFLLSGVYGLHPDEKQHSFYMDLVPGLGVPAAVSVKLQINIHLRPNPSISLLKDVPDVFLPMLWFEVRAEMTPEMASQVKMLIYFMSSSAISIGVWVVVLLVAALMVLGVLLYNRYRREPPYQLIEET